MFSAIEKNSVPVQIVDYYLDAISNGELRENDKLPSERMLCETLGVGRSTLREGLKILEMMSVIEKRSDGTFVKIQKDNIVLEAIGIDFAVGPINYFELIEVRNLLEVQSAGLAAEHASSADIKTMEMLCVEMKKHLNDVEQYAKHGTEFHIAIAKATDNDIMCQIFESIRYIMFDYQRHNMDTKEQIMRSYLEHLEIFNAIKKGDAIGSEKIMRRHLRYTQDLYEQKY